MDAKNLLTKIANQERAFRKEEFIAPFTEQTITAIIRMSGLHYKFRVVGFQGSGIGVFKPVDPVCAVFKRNAPWEIRRKYFDALPSLHVILSYETDQGWVAFPSNIESTQKRFALAGEIIVKGVSDAERFDVITTRFDGVHFWYDEPFAGADAIKSAEMRENFTPAMTADKLQIKGMTPEDRESFRLASLSWISFTKMSTQAAVESVLSYGGGMLGNYIIRGANIEIKWKSASGKDYTTLADKESLDIVSAGFCLDGEDTKFHLKDMPFLATQGEEESLIYIMPVRNIDFDGLDDA